MTPVRTVEETDEAVLADLGYKQEFKRAFNPIEVFGIAFSIIGLLPSIASVLVSSSSNGGAVSMVWGWALGSCFILCIGMALGELASSAPTSGGLYYLTYTLSSPRSRNILCWIVGYASTIGTITGIASIDWGCAVQIAAAVNIGSNGQLIITSEQSYGIYAAVILTQAIICSLGTKVLARLQTYLRSTSVINVLLAFCMGPDLSNILASPVNQPMAQIFLNSFGKSWTLVLWSFVILVQYIMGSSQVLAASRQSFAFARDGALPLSNVLYRMNTYTGTPVNTVWFDCLFALLIGLLALSGPAAVNAVFTVSVTATYVAYMTPIVLRFVFGKNFKPGPFSLGVLGGPIATIAVVFMLFMLVILCFPSVPGPQVATMNYTSVVLGGAMLLAMIWYYFPVYGGVHWFQGPRFNAEEGALSEGRASAGDEGSIQGKTVGTGEK